jgi:hypothetical protein
MDVGGENRRGTRKNKEGEEREGAEGRNESIEKNNEEGRRRLKYEGSNFLSPPSTCTLQKINIP